MPMETNELLQILACPKCLGHLVALEDNGSVAAFACKVCGVAYPVRDNIPIMLVEESVLLDEWNRQHPAAKEKA